MCDQTLKNTYGTDNRNQEFFGWAPWKKNTKTQAYYFRTFYIFSESSRYKNCNKI